MRALIVLITLSLCLAVTGAALAMSSASYELPWQCVSSGGGDRESATYALSDTIGQSSAPGLSESTSYRLGSGYWYGVPEILEIQISLKAGWNMVSVPVTPQDNSVASVFAGAEVVYTWNPTTKSYYLPTEVEPNKGYFVAMLGDTVISVSGVPVYNWTSDITAGWNMSGSVFDSVSFTDPQDSPDGSVEAFGYWWDPVTKSYDYVTTIEPKKGYWIAATQNCTLTLSTP